MGIEAYVLGAVYAFFSGIWVMLTMLHVVSVKSPLVIISLIWCGFLLAISFMEVFVKFKAPFLPRYLAIDVGRTVFTSLATIERSLCCGLWALVLLNNILHPFLSSTTLLLFILTIILILQLVWIHPKLDLRAKFVLHEAYSNELDRLNNTRQEVPEKLTLSQKMELKTITLEIQGKENPSLAYHGVYVVMEATKVIVLMIFAMKYLQ